MSIKRIEPTGRMSRAVVHNGTVYICGQVGSTAGDCVKAQTELVLQKITDLLEKAGSDKHHMLSATIYLKDIAQFNEMNEVWDAWVSKGNEPARACVEAAMAAENILVEIVVTAAVKE